MQVMKVMHEGDAGEIRVNQSWMAVVKSEKCKCFLLRKLQEIFEFVAVY